MQVIISIIQSLFTSKQEEIQYLKNDISKVINEESFEAEKN